ncbi:MAG: ATP-binding protein [Planctomycetota bacterium]|nr:ATP-binding protein [Planctomycetota bacterium]
MKQLTIISGKGGTGKTTFSAAFSQIASRDRVICIADADVDAANMHVLLGKEGHERTPFHGLRKASISPDRCTNCGLCYELCRFDAVKKPDSDNRAYSVSSLLCEGCEVCVQHCPVSVISSLPRQAGWIYRGECRFGSFHHARLGIAEGNSGKLVADVMREARGECEEKGIELLIADGPPGTGCPVIASLSQADCVIIVTEPTVSGVHDLERVQALAANFGAQVGIIVNKADLNPQVTGDIRRHCENSGAVFIGEMPFDRAFVDAMLERKTVCEYSPSLDEKMTALWDKAATELCLK